MKDWYNNLEKIDKIAFIVGAIIIIIIII